MQLINGSHPGSHSGESHSEDMSVDLPSRRGIPMPEKIEVASSI